MSRFGLTVVPAACIVIGLYVSLTVGCVKHVTTVIQVWTPPHLTFVYQPNYDSNMATVIAFQAIFDSCISLFVIASHDYSCVFLFDLCIDLCKIPSLFVILGD